MSSKQRITITDVVDDPNLVQTTIKGQKLSEDLWEEMEEEEDIFDKKLSYEIFQQSCGDEKDVGTIIKDTFGFYKVTFIFKIIFLIYKYRRI